MNDCINVMKNIISKYLTLISPDFCPILSKHMGNSTFVLFCLLVGKLIYQRTQLPQNDKMFSCTNKNQC